MLGLDEIITRFFNKENLRHAYLLETDDFDNVLNISKKILLDYNTEVGNIEYLIENNLYSDLKIIEPDGQWIKKEQISNLKADFKVKSSFNNKRIYIIKNAENLNKSAGNTMLKFLEEPEENIIALLVTNNRTKVLETIVSRCQYVFLDSNKKNKNNYDDNSIELCKILETKMQNASFDIIKHLDSYDERNKIKELLKEVIMIYENNLLLKMNIKVDKNKNVEDLFDKIQKNNTIKDIQKKINGLIFVIDSLEYNVNLKLLVDKLVILMFGVDYNV